MAVRLKIRIPIGIDEAADHPARSKLLVVSELDRAEEALVAQVEIRSLALQKGEEGFELFALLIFLALFPFLVGFLDLAETDVVGSGSGRIQVRVQEPDAPSSAHVKSGPTLHDGWRHHGGTQIRGLGHHGRGCERESRQHSKSHRL